MTSAEMLARLVAFDTSSGKSNLDLVGFARSWLDVHDVPYRLSYDASRQHANLHAIIGPVGPGGLAFSGHVDTVPVAEQSWTGDPFVLRQAAGRLIGRGACDMKGFVACMLAAVPALRALAPVRPIHLLLTYDEETGYHGVRRLIDDLHDSALMPEACIVGEASFMRPVLGQKGRLLVRAEVAGRSVHSSGATNGVNAVHAAAEAVAWLAEESRRLEAEGSTSPGFDPACTTLQVSRFLCEGLPNSVPGRASFDIEWRNPPDYRPLFGLERLKAHVARSIEPAMRARHPDLGFDWTVLNDMPAVWLDPGHPLARAALEASGKPPANVSYCSEAAVYHGAGIAAMVCGPGDVSLAHQPDEWIAASELEACDAFLPEIARRLCG